MSFLLLLKVSVLAPFYKYRFSPSIRKNPDDTHPYVGHIFVLCDNPSVVFVYVYSYQSVAYLVLFRSSAFLVILRYCIRFFNQTLKIFHYLTQSLVSIPCVITRNGNCKPVCLFGIEKQEARLPAIKDFFMPV